MATILLIEDAPDLGLYEARLLEARGHRVIRCSGAPTVLTACSMLRYGRCALPDVADLILFSTAMYTPIRHRSYRGADLLAAYRGHPTYGGIPMVVVTIGPPPRVPGRAPYEVVQKFSSPDAIVGAVERLLASRRRSRAPAGSAR